MDSSKTLPWAAQQTPSGKAKIVDALGFSVVNTTSGPYDDQRKTAAFIVRAANSHDQLVAALKEIIEADDTGPLIYDSETSCVLGRSGGKACKIARAALAAIGA